MLYSLLFLYVKGIFGARQKRKKGDFVVRITAIFGNRLDIEGNIEPRIRDADTARAFMMMRGLRAALGRWHGSLDCGFGE